MLQSINGPSEQPEAVINDQAFQMGEAGPVRVDGDWVYLTCQLITTNSVLIRLRDTGKTIELKLGHSVSKPFASKVNDGPRDPIASNSSSTVATQPNLIEAAASAVRKLGWMAGGLAVCVSLFVLGTVTVVPRFLKGWIGSSRTQPPAQAARSLPFVGVRSASPNLQESSITPEALLKRLAEIDWFQFEKVVQKVFREEGHHVELRPRESTASGVSLVLVKAGQRRALQCKHWKNSEVDVKPLLDFLRAMQDEGLDLGIFVSLARYTDAARALAAKHAIELVDGPMLARRLIQLDALGDSEVCSLLDEQRKFCPKCNSPMIYRTTGRDSLPLASPYWGCSRFPKCGGVL